jgi:hypothetical protein
LDIFSAVTAATETGTSCNDSERCCAVTTISSSKAALDTVAEAEIATAKIDLDNNLFKTAPHEFLWSIFTYEGTLGFTLDIATLD